jgi:DNA modification methylase
MAENLLYYGDHLDVLRRHAPDESVDLAYLDPPFNSKATYIQDIRLETAWQWLDLTYLAGAPAAAGPPRPYNRSVVARVYLPLIVR